MPSACFCARRPIIFVGNNATMPHAALVFPTYLTSCLSSRYLGGVSDTVYGAHLATHSPSCPAVGALITALFFDAVVYSALGGPTYLEKPLEPERSSRGLRRSSSTHHCGRKRDATTTGTSGARLPTRKALKSMTCYSGYLPCVQ